MFGWDLRISPSTKLPSDAAAADPVLNPKCTVPLPESPDQVNKNTWEGGQGGDGRHGPMESGKALRMIPIRRQFESPWRELAHITASTVCISECYEQACATQPHPSWASVSSPIK